MHRDLKPANRRHRSRAGVGKWQISPAGGDKRRWSRDGKQIFYIAADGKMMSVQPGVAVALFPAPHFRGYGPYDVSADGRFLLNVVADDNAPPAPISVVLNWWPLLTR